MKKRPGTRSTSRAASARTIGEGNHSSCLQLGEFQAALESGLTPRPSEIRATSIGSQEKGKRPVPPGIEPLPTSAAR
jgi:hypothetical protein